MQSRGMPLASARIRTRYGKLETYPTMLSSLFQSTTIPVLQEVVEFAQARQVVLAGNIANTDTPGYETRDLSVEDFQGRLKTAITSRNEAQSMSPGEPDAAHARPPLAEVAKKSQTVLRHDMNNVRMEHQVTEMVKNQLQHNTALTIMGAQFRMLQTAISGRV
jgi:flagellar basal-body rod protein FlgB